MQIQRSLYLSAMVAAAVLAAACTLKKQEAPPLTGPSGFGTSVDVAVTPDVLQGDGASQAVVNVRAFDSVGQPMRNLTLTVDTRVLGNVVTFGSLSARSIVTGSDGRATLVYTAPRVLNDDVIVDIAVTPASTNAANHLQRSAQIRLVPSGSNPLPAPNLVPVFSFSPESPLQGQTVLFSAEESTGSIAQFRWDFDDGESEVGPTVTHAFRDAGSFAVRLTLVDPAGRTASTIRSITVAPSAAPTADFTFSPANPRLHEDVHFNASASVAGPGRRIVRYDWDFGDGQSGGGERPTHRYGQPRTYNVTLTVTDDVGRTSVVTKSIDFAP